MPSTYVGLGTFGDGSCTLPDQYMRRVRTFLLAVTDEDGALPDIRSERLKLSASSLAVLRGGVKGGSNQLAALAAYRELSQSSDNVEAYYVLGKIFLEKQDLTSALENFTEAIQRQNRLPPDVRADLNQATGTAYVAMGAVDESVKYFSVPEHCMHPCTGLDVREAAVRWPRRCTSSARTSRRVKSFRNSAISTRTARRFDCLAGLRPFQVDWMWRRIGSRKQFGSIHTMMRREGCLPVYMRRPARKSWL